MARAIIAGQPTDELDELLEEVERAVGDYQVFIGTPVSGERVPDGGPQERGAAALHGQ